jgi:uncharacterized protein with FMN-binding domain
MNSRNKQSSFIRVIKKFLFSAFVLISFISYALENRGGSTKVTSQAADGAVPAPTGAPVTAADPPAGAAPSLDPNAPIAGPPPADVPLAVAVNGYKNGTYTGSVIDVNWGYVQVQATIQDGRINNVQFLQYPQDRNTSRRINSVAVPDLQQEAIQAQSANVGIVTGATLTSEGFQQSLQDALSQAKG